MSPEVKPKAINKVGIIGAGLMASQLAHLFIHRLEVPVVMKDVGQELVDKGLPTFGRNSRNWWKKDRCVKERPAILAVSSRDAGLRGFCRLRFCDRGGLREHGRSRQQVFGEAEPHLRPDAVLATNTSSLSVAEMAEVLKNPERVVGFHFFNPVAVMPLVEVIRAERTSEPALATAFNLAVKLKKTGILVKDSPAFLVNRILVRMLVDCLTLVDQGASFQEVDARTAGPGTAHGAV